jgi:hypothetical protein
LAEDAIKAAISDWRKHQAPAADAAPVSGVEARKVQEG